MPAPHEPKKRDLLAAEQQTPQLLHDFLRDIESTRHSVEVWDLLVGLGRQLDLPFIDFITASNFSELQRILFVRCSYDSRWLGHENEDPESAKWSYFRSHAARHLTPILVGLEFIDDYLHLPECRVEVLREAARRGMRAGFSVPLRVNAPPQAGMITFSGDHSKRDMLAIVKAHGWALNVAALIAHQRYVAHFATEFFDRNQISDKQRELLELIGRGLQDKQIAADLGISVSALRQRMHNLMIKTKCSNRAEIAALAMSAGMLPDPQRSKDPKAHYFLVQMDGVGVDQIEVKSAQAQSSGADTGNS
ncbi:ATP-dependent transcriptional regulator [Thalassovita gelatinovora]|uniref:ATP-dependent transcriptional regulator n=1 Tax=Thalassovita gelatinovora TaxID=53501 RepID=A0A0P1FJL2_THAGE|nr:LuxR family transcriptional regulator [Thalassovita gelatinovora]QIZ81542.1 LuxR family transcriptional regulator [Thalassovita gelatinovora]CUH67937.1 ATP-dependent transcriptional regulator [Thalassovita gelatinovora]SEQ25859.1 regulatory protein, luxR family [Thalassovita gelatinovora]